jgi:tRNA pseudouridine55 synthase
LDGILNIIKPPGMTSFDVVSYIGRRLGQKKTGHTGTLDPGACGVITLCTGKATKVVEYLVSEDKTYIAQLRLGKTTETLDALGKITSTRSYRYDRVKLEGILEAFLGKTTQIPPMYSAVRINGKRLYELARRGIDVKREKRDIYISDIEIIDDSDHDGILLKIVCSKGTYIRTLLADVGDRYGCGAHMGFLLRTRNGSFDISDAYTIEEVVSAVNEDRISEILLPLGEVFKNFEKVVLDHKKRRGFLNGVFLDGQNLYAALDPSKTYAVYDEEGELLGTGEIIEKGAKVYLKAKRLLLSTDENI